MLLGRPVTKNISGRGRVRRPTASALDRCRQRGHRMRRREFMILLGAAAVAWPLAGRAQQPPHVSRVGILSDESRALATSFEPFAQGLRDLGWIEGQNIIFELRYAERKYEILPSLAADLVRAQPDVIVAIGTGAARAAKNGTETIPIV